MTLHERLLYVMKIRLELVTPYASTWGQALKLFATPQQGPTAISTLASVIDQIWYTVGDNSTQVC